MKRKIKLLVMDNIKELGDKINEHLKNINNTQEDYLINFNASRFSNGEGKLAILEEIMGSDLYILSDVGNYGISYMLHGNIHLMGPDEHYADIKRAIAATSGHASKINILMPLLYEARQHKRRGNESLDCAIALQELERMGVSSIITMDAHDPSVCNAVPRLSFDNFYPTHIILNNLIKQEKLENPIVISPDMGAMERARYFADLLKCDVGVFYKRRDLSKVVNGKNPIVEHMYMGSSVLNRDILVVDDMIASGSSMLEVAEKLKKLGARRVYLIATFALFTEGIENFNESYKEQLFDYVYTTNLSYVPQKLKKQKWYKEVDCSNYLAEIINTLNKMENVGELWNKKIEMDDGK